VKSFIALVIRAAATVGLGGGSCPRATWICSTTWPFLRPVPPSSAVRVMSGTGGWWRV